MTAEQISSWKRELVLGVIKYGSLIVNFPVPANSLAVDSIDKINLQRTRMQNIFAQLMAASDAVLVFGLKGNIAGILESQSTLNELLVVNKNSCEVVRDIDKIQACKDFFIDQSRTYAELGAYKSEYPAYKELVFSFSIFPDSSLSCLSQLSIWALGALKSPFRGMSSSANRWVKQGLNAEKIVVKLELSYAGTYLIFYVPVSLREEFIQLVLSLDMGT